MPNAVGDRQKNPGFHDPEWLRARGRDVFTAIQNSGVFDRDFMYGVKATRDGIRSFERAAKEGGLASRSPGWERFQRAMAREREFAARNLPTSPRYEAWMVALIDTAIDDCPVPPGVISTNRYEYTLMRNSVAIILGFPEIVLPPKPPHYEAPPFTGKPPRLTPIPPRAYLGPAKNTAFPDIMESIEGDSLHLAAIKPDPDCPRGSRDIRPHLTSSSAAALTQPRLIHYPQDRDHLVNLGHANNHSDNSRFSAQSDRLAECETILALSASHHNRAMEDTVRILLDEARRNRARQEMLETKVAEQSEMLQRYEVLLQGEDNVPSTSPRATTDESGRPHQWVQKIDGMEPSKEQSSSAEATGTA